MSQFNHIEVDSSNIKSIAYDPKKEILEVIFHGEKKYQYQGVSQENWKLLNEAESKGRFFNMQIKPTHKFKQITR